MNMPDPWWTGRLELLFRVRGIGPFEDWVARPAPDQGFPSLITARFPHPDRSDREALTERLIEATGTARAVAHHHVRECLGMVGDAETGAAQIIEALEGTDLETLLKSRSPGATTPLSIGLYIGRQILDALAHAHSLDMVHGTLAPDQIFITRQGHVKVDFGLSCGRHPPQNLALTQPIDVRYTHPAWEIEDGGRSVRTDLYAVAAMIWELITGQPYREGLSDDAVLPLSTFIAGVPDTLDPVLRGALEGNASQQPTARALASALTRVFYVDLDADDDSHGRIPLAQWVDEVAEEPYQEPSLAVDIDEVDGGEAPAGPFTRVLMQRSGPVTPQELDHSDVDLGSLADPSKGEDSMATNPDRPALKSPTPPPVPTPTPTSGMMPSARMPTPFPDPRYPSARFPSQLKPMDVPPTPSGPMYAVTPPHGFAYGPPHQPGTQTRMIMQYNRMTWFLAGFITTFSLLVLYDVLFR